MDLRGRRLPVIVSLVWVLVLAVLPPAGVALPVGAAVGPVGVALHPLSTSPQAAQNVAKAKVVIRFIGRLRAGSGFSFSVADDANARQAQAQLKPTRRKGGRRTGALQTWPRPAALAP